MASRPYISAERQERCRDLWVAGVKATAICAEVGVSETYLKRLLTRLRLPRRNAEFRLNRNWPKERVETFTAMWERGATLFEIASALGIEECTVTETRKRLGLPGRRGRRGVYVKPEPGLPILSTAKTQRALWLWDAGRDTQQISTRLSCSEAAVYNSLSNARSARRVVKGARRDVG